MVARQQRRVASLVPGIFPLRSVAGIELKLIDFYSFFVIGRFLVGSISDR